MPRYWQRTRTWKESKEPDFDAKLDRNVFDPLTKRIMNKAHPWDMGRVPGAESHKLRTSAKAQKMSRGQMLAVHNDADHYQPELPDSNQCHDNEDKTDFFWGP